MIPTIPLPDAETLRTLFDYNPDTGQLSWRRGKRAGQPCGYLAGDYKGYLRVKVQQRHYRVHRLVWAYYYGEDIPEGLVIDHIDHDPQNNRIDNLRVVTVGENNANRRRVGHTPLAL